MSKKLGVFSLQQIYMQLQDLSLFYKTIKCTEPMITSLQNKCGVKESLASFILFLNVLSR